MVNLVLLNKDAPKESSALCLEQSVFHIVTQALFIEYRVGRQKHFDLELFLTANAVHMTFPPSFQNLFLTVEDR